MATKKKAARRAAAKTKAPKARNARPARARAGATRRRSAAPRRALVERQDPETLRLRSAAPGFTANDIERSLAFYTDVLGFVVKQRWEQEGRLLGAELLAGSISLYLGQDDWKKGRDRKKGEGFRIYCTTGQDVDALAARIKARGGTLEYEPKDQPWGGRDFAVVDPDGFKITIGSHF